MGYQREADGLRGEGEGTRRGALGWRKQWGEEWRGE